jgi:hypothetical protein
MRHARGGFALVLIAGALPALATSAFYTNRPHVDQPGMADQKTDRHRPSAHDSNTLDTSRAQLSCMRTRRESIGDLTQISARLRPLFPRRIHANSAR